MFKRETCSYLSAVAILIVVVSLFALSQAVTKEPRTEVFSCWTIDTAKHPIRGYYSESSGKWYLFVPSTLSIHDMTLYYTGPIVGASSGTLNARRSFVKNGFAAGGDQITLRSSDNTDYTIQVMQSDLPAVHIILNGVTLDEIHADGEAKRPGNSVYIMDPDSSDLTVENCVEVRGRGNTTWGLFEKKPYQIKFETELPVLGMAPAKKWVLLANAGDDSLIRNQLVYRMARNLDMPYVPSFEFVDLWVDGEYLGTYLLGEKNEIDPERLNLQDAAGALFELDGAYYASEDIWFYNEISNSHFVLKDIVLEDEALIEAAVEDFDGAVTRLYDYLYSTSPKEITIETLSSMIDVDSFIKYYLVNEYVLQKESTWSSFYWYKDGKDDVLHLGPIWDFDTCLGNEDPAPFELTFHTLFHSLLAIPEVSRRAQTLLDEYKDDLAFMVEDADVLETQIEASAAMNYLRWDVLGKPVNKNGSNFQKSFPKAVEEVKNTLRKREALFAIPSLQNAHFILSDDRKTMEIYFDTDFSYDSVKFAVWSTTNDQDDLIWYDAYPNVSGDFCATVDLIDHGDPGLYLIHTYADDEYVAFGQTYVDAVF